ncbi:hypothetical protein Sthe_0846 [Sphaerobacter thermophilus DSM 20745]|uniref:Uncharacterized protein n=1 Tax=Sphaerobacter thermophilus (strain ATCC 49802 / DSM 20745 / KCCM 41009 / NCIMB 13125 / S 6022) TaxID=479434 RepID=D1C216_SPHTD|nr:hypothetical protein Sthe_0846 [Sphaerobacter thermophilus DSM 20745]
MSGLALPPLLALALVTQAQDAVSHVARGMLGGLFNKLVAPLVFTSVIEYPAVLILAHWRPTLAGNRFLPSRVPASGPTTTPTSSGRCVGSGDAGDERITWIREAAGCASEASTKRGRE